MSSELRQRKYFHSFCSVELPRTEKPAVEQQFVENESEYDDEVAPTPLGANGQRISIPVKKTFLGRLDQFFGYVLGDAYTLVKHPHTITWLILFFTIAVTYFGFIRVPGICFSSTLDHS